MNHIVQHKESQINSFISSLDLNNPDRLSTREIKKGLADILGETPGVEFEYVHDPALNESGQPIMEKGRPKLNETLKSVTVFYTYQGDDGLPKFGRKTYIVN